MARFSRWIVMALFVLGISACQRTPNILVPFQQTQMQHGAWRLSGTMSILNNGKRVFAHYHWTHKAKQDVIEVSGTFHVSASTIIITPSQAILIASNGKRYTAPTVEVLMRRHLGWSLPIRALTYWVRGLAMPNEAAIGRSLINGYLQALTQLGWQLHWYRYHLVNGAVLPKLMTLEKDGWAIRIAITGH